MNENLIYLLSTIAVSAITFGLIQWTKRIWVPFFFFLIVVNGALYINYLIAPDTWEGWFTLGLTVINLSMVLGISIGIAIWYGYRNIYKKNG